MHSCLVVDDDLGQRLLTRLIVEGCRRFRVVGEAEDGRQAINLAKALGPDLILLDLNMPGMSGDHALPKLRLVAPESTIYVLSTVKDPIRLRAAERSGADGFLDKMLSNERLSAALVSLRLRTEVTTASLVHV